MYFPRKFFLRKKNPFCIFWNFFFSLPDSYPQRNEREQGSGEEARRGTIWELLKKETIKKCFFLKKKISPFWATIFWLKCYANVKNISSYGNQKFFELFCFSPKKEISWTYFLIKTFFVFLKYSLFNFPIFFEKYVILPFYFWHLMRFPSESVTEIGSSFQIGMRSTVRWVHPNGLNTETVKHIKTREHPLPNLEMINYLLWKFRRKVVRVTNYLLQIAKNFHSRKRKSPFLVQFPFSYNFLHQKMWESENHLLFNVNFRFWIKIPFLVFIFILTKKVNACSMSGDAFSSVAFCKSSAYIFT